MQVHFDARFGEKVALNFNLTFDMVDHVPIEKGNTSLHIIMPGNYYLGVNMYTGTYHFCDLCESNRVLKGIVLTMQFNALSFYKYYIGIEIK